MLEEQGQIVCVVRGKGKGQDVLEKLVQDVLE